MAVAEAEVTQELLIVSKVCLLGSVDVLMMFFKTRHSFSRVIGPNSDIIISIGNLRIDIISCLESPV